MTFSIIGTGNIAWFFGKRLSAGKHRCTGVFGRNKEEVKKLADALLVEKYGSIQDHTDAISDVCFLTVTDHAIADVVAQLKFTRTILVHTAGAVPIDVLEKAAADRGVFWPVYSILKNNPPGHRNIPCCWEVSSDRAKKYLLEMGHAITDQTYEAKYEQRKWLHLSAVIGNNFVNHLLAICEQICGENNIPFQVLQPIIEQTFERMRQQSPKVLQTGPAVRHDQTTIQAQEALLADHPAWQKIYTDISNSIKTGL